jgi:hypothetical protein
MNDAKYGPGVHTATIAATIRDSSGKLVMEATLERQLIRIQRVPLRYP